MKRMLSLVLALAACMASADQQASAKRLYDRPTWEQMERAIAAANWVPYVPRPSKRIDPTFDQMDRLIRAIQEGGATGISASNPAFSNAVLAVGIDTNAVAQIGELKEFFDGLPVGTVGTSLGGIILALLGAVALLKKKTSLLKSNGTAEDQFATDLLGKQVSKDAIGAEIAEKGTAPDAHLEAPTDERLKLVLADNTVAYDSAKALPYKLASAIGDRAIASLTLNAASTDIALPSTSVSDTTVKDFILDVTNAYSVEGVATDAGINIPRTDVKLVTRDGESLSDVTTVKAGKSAFLCFTQKSPVVVGGVTYPCWFVVKVELGEPA